MKKFGTAIILAGGKSSRMGFDKQFIKIRDTYLIDIIINNLTMVFEKIIIVSNIKPIHKNSSVLIVEDELKNLGPLGGIHAGLKHSKSMYSYVTACDMPYINIKYIKYILRILEQSNEKDALITKFGEWIEPFNAFYCKDIAMHIENHIDSGQRSIFSLVNKLNVEYIEEKIARCFSPNWTMFRNLNTKDDLMQYSLDIKRLENRYESL